MANDFGVNLTKKKAIFKKKGFYKPNAPARERTLVCISGPGCKPDQGTGRKMEIRWLNDDLRETISSDDLEAYIDDEGNVRELTEAVDVEVEDVSPEPKKEIKIRRKK